MEILLHTLELRGNARRVQLPSILAILGLFLGVPSLGESPVYQSEYVSPENIDSRTPTLLKVQ